MKEVCDVGDGTVAGGLAAIKPDLTWGFRMVFDRLDADVRRTAQGTRRCRGLSAAIALYHVVIEATLAQPGQHFITTYLLRARPAPRLPRGDGSESPRDEQRHIAFGVKLLSDIAAPDPVCRRAVAELLREVLPWTASVLVPPTGTCATPRCSASGSRTSAGRERSRWKRRCAAPDLPIEDLPGPPIFAFGLPPERRVENGLRLVRGGVLGEKTGAPSSDHDTMAALFDLLGA